MYFDKRRKILDISKYVGIDCIISGKTRKRGVYARLCACVQITLHVLRVY